MTMAVDLGHKAINPTKKQNILRSNELSQIVYTYRVQSLYKTLHYKMDLDITRSCCGSQVFNHGILPKNYRKMTIKWSFSYTGLPHHLKVQGNGENTLSYPKFDISKM